MPILENMTISEELNYKRLKKMGYTDEEAKWMLLKIRNVPQDLREKAYQAIKKNMIENSRKQD